MKLYSAAAAVLISGSFLGAQTTFPSMNGCPVTPANSVWNSRIDNLPVHPSSDQYVATLKGGGTYPGLHPDFGSDPMSSYPVNIVHGNSMTWPTTYINWPFTSDAGPFPLPPDLIIGPGPDQHIIVFDVDNCVVYEGYEVSSNGNGSFTADAISKFDLRSNAQKPAYWSSSNAAGTPQLPLLIRYEEAAAGHIDHAVTITGYPTANAYVWPAVHSASYANSSAVPPMGTRFRLKANVDISHFSGINQAILNAMKVYGVVLTDNGASFHIQGVPDSRWNDADLHNLTNIPASAFEAVDESSLMADVNSAAAAAPPASVSSPTTAAAPAGFVNMINKQTGQCASLSGNAPQTGIIVVPCNGSIEQKFQFLPYAGAWNSDGKTWSYGAQGWMQYVGHGYIVLSAKTQQSVSVPGINYTPGTQLQQYPFYDFTNYLWAPVKIGSFFYVQGYSNGQVFTQSGGKLVQQPLIGNGSDAELWALTPVN